MTKSNKKNINETINVEVTAKNGYIYDTLRKKGDKFQLVDVVCVHERDELGEPLIYTAQEQFSSKWMKKI